MVLPVALKIIDKSKRLATIDNGIDKETQLLLILGGSSESGKSAFGKLLLEEQLANRIKYLRVAREISTRDGLGDDPMNYLNVDLPEIERIARSKKLWQGVTDVASNAARVSVVETMKHPHLLTDLGQLIEQGAINARFLMVYIDAPFEKRVEREVLKTGLSSSEITEKVKLKDEEKSRLGDKDLSSLADIVVWNNGEAQDYFEWVLNFGSSMSEKFQQAEDSSQVAIAYE
jgi:dephospho-CoA kinase